MRKNPKETLVFANEQWKRGVDHVGVSLTQRMIINLLLFPTHIIHFISTDIGHR